MSLKCEVAKSIEKFVFRKLKQTKVWRVLVLDHFSTKIISSCFRMQDITDMGVTLVEDLHKKREILPMEAIYLLSPSEESVKLLMADFTGVNIQYQAAHVFFTKACPSYVLDRLVKSSCMNFCRSLVQLNLAFVAVESLVYSLDTPVTSLVFPQSPEVTSGRLAHLERVAEQLATLCATLGEYPHVRYKNSARNLEFARLLQLKLDAYKADDPTMGQGPHQDKSALLILDRGFDPISPLLHELTLQAMAYDLLRIKNGLYSYEISSDGLIKEREVLLDESDSLWVELRHQHIADVSRLVPEKLRQFAKEKRVNRAGSVGASGPTPTEDSVPRTGGGDVNQAGPMPSASIRDLARLMKMLPQYQRELSSYCSAIHLAEHCMSSFTEGQLSQLCTVEQDLVMGQTAQGEVVKDHVLPVMNILKPEIYSDLDRLRLLLIYLITKGSITETNLLKLLDSACLPRERRALVSNMRLLDINLLAAENGQPHFQQQPAVQKLSGQPYLAVNRPNRVDDRCYNLSRWSPYLLDLIEEVINDKLDNRNFPYLVGVGSDVRGLGRLSALSAGGAGGMGPSLRMHASSWRQQPAPQHQQPSYQHFYQSQKQQTHCGPRLIVCIIGGVTYSEIRTAYIQTQLCRETRRLSSENPTSLNTKPCASDPSVPPPPPHLINGGGLGWNWEVVIGGTHTLTPQNFLEDLEGLSNPIPQAPP